MRNPVTPKAMRRWRGFWQREAVDRPLLGAAFEMPIPTEALPSGESRLAPKDLNLEAYMAACDQAWEETRHLRGDAIWAAAPFQGLPWMEAICGCGIVHSGGSLWAEPITQEPEVHLAHWRKSPWLAQLLIATSALAEHGRGRYPVGLPVLRGPADIVSAMRRPANFCLDFYDAPGRLRIWLSSCKAIYEEVVEAVLAVLAPFNDGCAQVSRQVWAPGACLETQEDAASLISPQHYRKFILPLERELWRLAAYAFRHVHSNAMHQLDDLLSEPALRAVEITLDDVGPPLVKVAQRIAQVQAAGKPVIVHGTMNAQGMAELVQHLSPVGLYIAARTKSASAGNRLLYSALQLCTDSTSKLYFSTKAGNIKKAGRWV